MVVHLLARTWKTGQSAGLADVSGLRGWHGGFSDGQSQG